MWHALEAQLCAVLVQMDAVVCARWRPALDLQGKDGGEKEKGGEGGGGGGHKHKKNNFGESERRNCADNIYQYI